MDYRTEEPYTPRYKADCPLEFSKKILYWLAFGAIVIIVFTMYMIWETKNLSPLTYLIPSLMSLLSVAIGFYYWKAKAENMIKLGWKEDHARNDQYANPSYPGYIDPPHQQPF